MKLYVVSCVMNNGDIVTFDVTDTFSDLTSEINGRLLGKGSPTIRGKKGTEDCYIVVKNISTFTVEVQYLTD